MRILTEELIRKAIELARPGVQNILDTEGMTWGPKWVYGWATGPGIPEDEKILFSFGQVDPNWKSPDFGLIAYEKMLTVEREKLPTSVIASTKPWLLEDDEYLYAGATTRDGISVAVSGAMGRVDEAIAEIVLSLIVMLALMDADQRIKEDRMQI